MWLRRHASIVIFRIQSPTGCQLPHGGSVTLTGSLPLWSQNRPHACDPSPQELRVTQGPLSRAPGGWVAVPTFHLLVGAPQAPRREWNGRFTGLWVTCRTRRALCNLRFRRLRLRR